jgi:hypothetical protein
MRLRVRAYDGAEKESGRCASSGRRIVSVKTVYQTMP